MIDVAVFLDLDNLVIGAKQASLTFDIDLVLDHIKQLTNGRIVLRRAYGDWRQNQKLLKKLATAGFIVQTTVALNNYGKNLADMQIVVDTMDTLVDGHQYSTYVLITGDRDFTPLVQSLRKRGKQVIGIGIKHTASRSLISLCDQYIFYKDISPGTQPSNTEVKSLLTKTLNDLLKDDSFVRASVLKQRLIEMSEGTFNHTNYVEGSFRKFLASYPELIEVKQEKTTTYVRRPQKQGSQRALHLRYRSGLKKQRLRVVPFDLRLLILKDVIMILQQAQEHQWQQLADLLAKRYQNEGRMDISKNIINAILVLARKARVIRTLKGTSLATAPVLLHIQGQKLIREAIIRCDVTYLQGIQSLSEPFDLREASLALYDTADYVQYLQVVLSNHAPNGQEDDPD